MPYREGGCVSALSIEPKTAADAKVESYSDSSEGSRLHLLVSARWPPLHLILKLAQTKRAGNVFLAVMGCRNYLS